MRALARLVGFGGSRAPGKAQPGAPAAANSPSGLRVIPAASLLAPMDPARVREVRQSLRRILDCHPAARAIWPSIALVDRSMARHGGIGLERLSAQVLQDAGQVLNRLLDELCEEGVIVLLERIDRVMRAVHGCTLQTDVHWEAVRPAEVQVLESTITEFMEIDRAWDCRQAAAEDAERRALAA